MKTFVILVAIDFSTAGDAAVRRALELAAAYPLSCVHVATIAPLEPGIDRSEEPAAAVRLRELAMRVVSEFDAPRRGRRAAPVVIHVAVGEAADGIVQLATSLGADLVLVGSHGRRGVARALHGSVAERVVRLAPCPVLVVRDVRASSTATEPCPACTRTEATSGGRERLCPLHARAEAGTTLVSHEVDGRIRRYA